MMPLVQFFSEPFWYRLGLTLAHFLWQGAAVTILAGAVIELFRIGRGNARYAAYLLAFAVMAACPAATFTLLEPPAEPAISPDEMAKFTPFGPITGQGTFAHGISRAADGATPGAPRKLAPIGPARVRTKISNCVHAFIPPALVVWSAGVLVLSIRLLLGLVGVCRWRRDLKPLPATLAARVGLLSKRLGMANFSRAFISPLAIQAMAVGYLRPMILLPAALVMEMQPEMLEAVIAHELAHIRRFDLWVNLLQRVVETLLFFHPAVWWLSHRIQVERELCCDELAVMATGEPIVYATALESAMLAALVRRQPALAAGFGADKRPTLSRVRHVLGLAPSQPRVRFWLAGIVTITFMLALAVPFLLIRHAQTNSADVSAFKNIADRFEVRFDRAEYATSSSSARTAQGSRTQTKERLRLYTNVGISDPKFVLGIAMRGAITQFETGKGRTVDVAADEPARPAGPYMGLSYSRPFVTPPRPKPAGWKTAIRSFLGLSPPKISGPRLALGLDESRVRLELDSGSPGPDVEKIDHLKGYFYALVAQSLEYTDVPYKQSEKWVRLTPDLEIRVLEAKCDGSGYECRIETREGQGIHDKGRPMPGSLLPSRLVVNRQLLGDDGQPIHSFRPGLLMSSAGGRIGGSGSSFGRIKKIRFVVAVNPSHCKVPFELENIPIPGHQTTNDNAPARLGRRRVRTVNRSRPAPNPSDGAILKNKWANLSWEPGEGALSYDVYLGDSLADVNNGAPDTFRGNVKAPFMIAGFHGYPYPEGLVPGTTYYWRVDQISEVDPSHPRKGDIRSFSIPPRTAHNPVPADGADSVDSNVQLSWDAGLGALLHWVYFGDDHDSVANASGGSPAGRNTFTPPALVPGTTYYWRVDEFNGRNTEKGDVWSFTVKGGAE